MNTRKVGLLDELNARRNPRSAIEASGFSKVDLKSFDVPGMGPIAPHISGIATV